MDEEGTIRGWIYQRGTRDPLRDARIEVGDLVAFVDDDWRFEIVLPVGSHDVHAVLEGHRTEVATVDVETDGLYEVTFRLERDSGRNPYETVIHGRRDEQEVTRITLGDEEIHDLPGTMGDPFRAIEALGRRARPHRRPYYFIRGAPPSGTAFYLDGVRVPQLFLALAPPSSTRPSSTASTSSPAAHRRSWAGRSEASCAA